MQKEIKDNSEATVNLKPSEKKWEEVMDSLTDGRLERLKTQVGRLETRLDAVEKTLQEIIILLKQQGIERGKNYAAP